MDLLESTSLLMFGILKRMYWLLPALVLDPFDLAERLFKVNYDMPQWLAWILAGFGIFIAMLLTYHELRMQKVTLEQPINWIDDYKNRNGKLPPLPDYYSGQLNYYTPGQPISKEVQPIPPSGQWWNARVPSEQQQWRELVEWLGGNPDDLLAQMRMMLPKTPKGH